MRAIALLLMVTSWLLTACEDEHAVTHEAASAQASARIQGALSVSDSEGFARVFEPRVFKFPADHGTHPNYRTEWWYFTGNLHTEQGRHFGFQLTFFRFALAPATARTSPSEWSRWRTQQAWMAHFAVTDSATGRFHSFERFSRGAMGFAGASKQRFEVWLEDWAARGNDDSVSAERLTLALRAADSGVALALELLALKPRVLQGDRGFSAKSPVPGNASYYYSYPRLQATGAVTIDNVRHSVSGLAWIDREWSTSALARDQSGWDWFALQLDDGRDLMFYRLRGRDGVTHPSSAGVLVSPGGVASALSYDAVRLSELEHWREDGGGLVFPVRWRLKVDDLDLTVRAMVNDQLHRHGFRYWEGAVAVSGRAGERSVSGHGYLEMTPY